MSASSSTGSPRHAQRHALRHVPAHGDFLNLNVYSYALSCIRCGFSENTGPCRARRLNRGVVRARSRRRWRKYRFWGKRTKVTCAPPPRPARFTPLVPSLVLLTPLALTALIALIALLALLALLVRRATYALTRFVLLHVASLPSSPSLHTPPHCVLSRPPSAQIRGRHSSPNTRT